jgi:hypothetical protein
MKNIAPTQSRSNGRLSKASSFCRHSFLCLLAASAISIQAGQPTETVFMGGTSALSVTNFGTSATVLTPLTANTVVTGTVGSGFTTDRITFNLPADYKIDSASVTVTNYVAASGIPDTTPNVVFKSGMTTYGSAGMSGNGTSTAQFTSPLPAGQFDLEISAPSGLQSGGTIQPAFVPQVSPPTTTYGSASYVITLNISAATVPITQLAGTYIGLVASNMKRLARDSKIANIVNPAPVAFKPIPNEELNARLDMTVSVTGAVTGRLVFGPTVVAFTGRFTVTNSNTRPELVIPISAYNRNLVLRFDIDEDYLGYFHGNLIQQGDEVYFGEGGFGWKNIWTNTKRPTADMTSYKSFRISNMSRGEAPIGNGFGMVKTGDTTDLYQVAGTLADGEKIITNGFYGPKGDVLIYQYLYASKGKGSFSGSASLQSGVVVGALKQVFVDTITPLTPQFGGEFSWIKQPSPLTQVRSGPPKKYGRPASGSAVSSDSLYPRGFHVFASLNGASYTPPAVGQVLKILGSSAGSIRGVNTFIYFSFDSKTTDMNAGAGISIISKGSASSLNSVSVTSALSGMGGTPLGQTYSGLSFQTFDVGTGYFRGSYSMRLPLRAVTFEGMMVYQPSGGYYEGFGYYLLRLFEGDTPVLGQQRGSGRVYLGND